MPKYTCTRCLKEFTQKGHYTYHINKKFKCEIVAPESDISVSTIDSIKCNYCGIMFTRGSSLTRHIESRCKIKKENDTRMKEITTLSVRIEKMEKDMNELKEENSKYKKNIQT